MLKNAVTGQHILELDKIQMNQAGRYTCKIQNDSGTQQIHSEVVVIHVPQILPPPAKSKKGSYFRKLYKCEHEIARGTTSILKVGVRVGVF